MANAPVVRPAKQPMDQIRSSAQLQSYTFAGNQVPPQVTFRLPEGRLFRRLMVQIDVVYTTTTSTLYPHFADVANLIGSVLVKTNGGQILTDLQGYELFAKFVRNKGVTFDNKALVGAASASGATARMTIPINYFLEDGLYPEDALLETYKKKVDFTLNLNNPLLAGTLFGDVTGLSAVTVNIKIISDEYVCTTAVKDYLLATTVQRTMVSNERSITQTNDQFVIDDQLNSAGVLHRKWSLIGLKTANGNLTPDDTILNPDKALQVKTTASNTVIQDKLVRLWRGETIERREDSGIVASMIDVNFTVDDSVMQALPSTSGGELFLTTPVVTNGNTPKLRIITDTVQPNYQVVN